MGGSLVREENYRSLTEEERQVCDLAVDWGLDVPEDILSRLKADMKQERERGDSVEKRKPRPLRTERGEYIRLLDYKISELEEVVDDIRKERRRYLDLRDRVPDGIKGVGYSAEKVKGGGLKISFADVISRLDAIERNLCRYTKELDALRKKRKKLVAIYKNNKNVEAAVFYYREIMEFSQEQTAKAIGYSTRQIQRIESRLKSESDFRE